MKLRCLIAHMICVLASLCLADAYQRRHNYRLQNQFKDYLPSNIVPILNNTNGTEQYKVAFNDRHGELKIIRVLNINEYFKGNSSSSTNLQGEVTSVNKSTYFFNTTGSNNSSYFIINAEDEDAFVQVGAVQFIPQGNNNSANNNKAQNQTLQVYDGNERYYKKSKFGAGYNFQLGGFCQTKFEYTGPPAYLEIYNPYLERVKRVQASQSFEITLNSTNITNGTNGYNQTIYQKLNATEKRNYTNLISKIWVVYIELKDDEPTERLKSELKFYVDGSYFWINSTQSCKGCLIGSFFNTTSYECEEPFNTAGIGASIFFFIVFVALGISLIFSSRFTEKKLEAERNVNPYTNLGHTVCWND